MSFFENREIYFSIFFLEIFANLFRLLIPKMGGKIDVSKSKFFQKSGSVFVKLCKAPARNWDDLIFKKDSIKESLGKPKDSNPESSMMDMMKKMYEDGDEETKRSIAKAWTESKDKGAQGGDAGGMPGMPGMGGMGGMPGMPGMGGMGGAGGMPGMPGMGGMGGGKDGEAPDMSKLMEMMQGLGGMGGMGGEGGKGGMPDMSKLMEMMGKGGMGGPGGDDSQFE